MTHSALCMVSCVGLASMWSFWVKGQQRQRPHVMLPKLKKHRGAITPWRVTKTHKTNATNKHRQAQKKKKIFCLISLFIPKLFTSVKTKNIKEYQNNVSPELLQTVFSPLLRFCCPPTEDKSGNASIYFGGKFNAEPHRAEMALAATRLPSGRVRSVIASTTLGLARAGSFTNSET